MLINVTEGWSIYNVVLVSIEDTLSLRHKDLLIM